jgi:flagellar FliJ protein
LSKFVFRLAVVLRQRKRAEQEAQRELAVRHAKLVEAENDLRNLDDRVRAASEDLRQNHLTGSLDLNFLAAHRRYLNAMQRQALDLIQKIAVAQKHVDEARLLLAEAAKKRKAIEKLREKQFARWQEEIARKELAQMDEIGMQIAYANLADPSDNDSGSNERAAST